MCNMTCARFDDSTDAQGSLGEVLPQARLNTMHINPRVEMRADVETGLRSVFVGGVPFFVLRQGDEQSLRFVCVQLRLQGLAEQLELSAAFGHDRVTQYRWERKYEEEGLIGLAPYRPKGRTPSVPTSIEETVATLHDDGLGMRMIASRLGLSLGVVRGVYKRRGLDSHRRGGEQMTLPEELAEGTKPVSGGIGETGDNEGVIAEEQSENGGEEAVTDEEGLGGWDGLLRPEYESEQGEGFGGVLLALPLLAQLQVIEVFKRAYRYLSLIPLYGLETLVTLMVFMALARIKRPEQLKSHSPFDLGKVLGLPRAPEVKTVRRKLGILARRGQAAEVMVELARVALKQEQDLLGYMYVDGHVRAYSGKHDLAKGYSVQRHMPVRATIDFWANDRRGDPVFVVTSEINESLSQMLRPLLKQAEELVADGRPITVIFDRGGWSPQLFVELIEAGHHLITYRKGRSSDLAEEAFELTTATIEGSRCEYRIHDEPDVQVGVSALKWSSGPRRPLMMRQVTKLCDSGHQTQVLTSRRDLPAADVLWRMFNRWRQENFFKYMRQEFAIDSLVEYGAVAVSPGLEQPNPERRSIEAQIKALRTNVEKLQGQRCELLGDLDTSTDAPEGFERFIPHRSEAQQLCAEIRRLKTRLEEMEVVRSEMPDRISASGLERLTPEKKLLADLFKATAYRIETELVRKVAPHYARTEDEGRALIAAALSSRADLEVTPTELRVVIAPQSSPHRTKAIADLCHSLNKLSGVVPGTSLRLVLASAPHPAVDVARAER